ncbi:MAG TPA: hypothetical protein PLI09_15640 [Candidatus Hydrogenedentes bacterium]|nr:hypothetical protein [Candidatus Hydrogenedentota bacterium]
MISRYTLGIMIMLLFIGCSYCPVQTENITMSFQKVEDQGTFIHGSDLPVLLITCPSGIGGAAVTFTGPAVPNSFRIGLRYSACEPFRRLEGFQVSRSDGSKWADPPRISRLGYLEVIMPDTAFEQTSGTLSIDWVDMYR